jgi:P4 family phage/plasmid primase-like protien
MNNYNIINNTYSYNKLDTFLQNNRAEKGGHYSHTRIGNKEMNIYGGSFNIYEKDYNKFLDLYYECVFINKNEEFLTEKQLLNDGPLLVDIDFRFNSKITQRQHTKEHIIDLIYLYLNKLNEIYSFSSKSNINVYILEKKDTVKFDNKTKDGIHLIFTIKMSKPEQSLLRKKILNEIEGIWNDLALENSFNDIFDEGITKGYVNWQLYGSKKPGNLCYNLTYYLSCIYENDDWSIKENKIESLDMRKHIELMSARYSNHNSFELLNNEYLLEAINNEKLLINNKTTKNINSTNKLLFEDYDLSQIKNVNELDNLIEILFNELSTNDYELKELHDFTLILPKCYYDEGSYSKWIRVGWALKNTHEKLFLTWIKFSSQSSTFSYNDISNYYNMWKSFNKKNEDGLTTRSIMFWAKTDNFESYEKIREKTISYFIDKTLDSIISKDKIGEFDLAIVLYQLFKDRFVCVSIKNNQWYEYKENKWNENDSGNSLRLLISKKMHDIYMKKANDLIEIITKMENNDENADTLKIKSCKLGDICILLKTTSWKNNIMKEAKELFYDKEFLDKLDSNPYLLSFNNYVVDFKNKNYRKGRPDDFISKSTNIDYIPSNILYKNNESLINEIKLFMKQLFPIKELEDYMWEHLASTLIGTNENQTFNIYTGSGCNGKSKLVELMGKGLGDYKATVPITLITQKRGSIGGTSSEIVQLQGVRYAVMQEPSKGDKINEGIMKEITGGDPIQGRALFKETVTFIPQFKLVVCTNVLFDIATNDDGTWRRIRLCDFMSKFTDSPYNNEEKFPKENFPYQYLIDKKIDEKFEVWAPLLMSMLVNIAFETQGNVKDCSIVMAGSDKYREGQDYLTEFAKEKIMRKHDGKIKKTELLEEFKNWFIMHYGRNNLPNGKEITDYMNKKYGKCNRGKWFNVEINYEEESDIEDDSD